MAAAVGAAAASTGFEAAEAAMPAEGGKPRLDDHREVKVSEAKGCLAKLIVSHNDAVLKCCGEI